MHTITLHQVTVKLRCQAKALGTTPTAASCDKCWQASFKTFHFSSTQGKAYTDIINEMSLYETHTHARRAHLDWLNQKQILIQTSDFVLYYTHTTLCHKPLSHVAVL